jgi:hypothetical protein
MVYGLISVLSISLKLIASHTLTFGLCLKRRLQSCHFLEFVLVFVFVYSCVLVFLVCMVQSDIPSLLFVHINFTPF